MNSDNVTPDGLSPVDTNQEMSQAEEAPKRRGSRRSTRAAANNDAQSDTNVTPTEEAAPPARTRRGRRAPAATRQADSTPNVPGVSGPEEETLRAEVTPLTTQGALVSEGITGDAAAGDAPATRSRRRRGRGTRETASDAEPLAGVLDESATATPPDAMGEDTIPAVEEGPAGEATDAEAPATAAGRRSRRRGRGRGRGDTPASAEAQEAQSDEEQATPLAEEEPAAAVSETEATSTPQAPSEAEPAAPILSPAVLRRFDHRDWRVRGGRAAPVAPVAYTPQPAQAPTATPAARDTGERYGGDRSSRHRRFGERRDDRTRGGEITAAEPRVSEEMETPSLAPTPIMATPTPPVAARASGPIIMPERDAGLSAVPATSGQRGTGDRVEQLIASQAALLQQQQQTLQSLASTIARLERTMERLSSGGITAGMPRAGMFIDAPNIIYAAENARINLDYGRMLDFLSRGREMVHAIVYAPVTEDTGHRMENQRFVAPFLQKGYKLVTKPLKRFPDGTAKGNFDIELAIDIVTMSQRLDVVILISGDSDFSRLIELIQSRGVRVEVVAFASNVSWELVQMADVFIDVGQYLHEFQ